MDERATGDPYALPAEIIKARRAAKAEITRDEYWVSLPSSFWLNGWIAVLSAPAIAMLLVLLDEAGGTGRYKNLWHSPRQASERFALSQDTRTVGLLELEAYKIIDKKRTSISPGVFDFRRMRNVYDLHLEQLTVAPGEPRPQKTLAPEQSANLNIKELEQLLKELEIAESSSAPASNPGPTAE